MSRAELTVPSRGVELAVLEAGERQRPTVVLVHGYPDTRDLWTAVIERLEGRFHVLAYDVRGAGRSSTPRGPAAYRFERLGDDLEAVIGALAPDGTAHLVGHDWGAIAGWEFATSARFDGRLRSFTAIAGPSLDQVGASLGALLRRGRLLAFLGRVRRSWYVLAMWTPGGPTFAWRVLLAGGRWRAFQMGVERAPDGGYLSRESLASDGLHGSNLYRANILGRTAKPRPAVARVPVQLIVPAADHFISSDYYERAEQHAPGLRRRTVPGSHWAPRTQPELIARYVGEFVDAVEAGLQVGSEPPG